MSDSTIDDALKLLETGKGNPDRLKQIIESFQKRSMISMQDRKYVDALVEQYLTPRHRQMTSRMKETKIPRIRKGKDSSFKITEVKATSKDLSNHCRKCGSVVLEGNTFCTNCRVQTENVSHPRKEDLASQPRKEELASRESTIEEKFIEHIETDRSSKKKSSNGKLVGIIVGVIVIIIIGGGAAYIGSSSDLFLANTEIKERITCESSMLLVSSTKVPGFPDPEKDLRHYLDRYYNEPKYKEWFDKNFPGQTIREVLLPPEGNKNIVIPGFPNPEKDLQHYLDRYDNEPKYKEWFDKNFPGQTIREAVC